MELKDLAVPLEYHTPERDILIAFYKATNGDNWTKNTNWCSDRPLDEWYGVRTDGEGYVMEMYLDDNNLTGTARLSGLSRLMTLYLSGNHFTGVDFGNLPELVDLRLERNEDIVTMDFPRSIGKELMLIVSSNPQLTTLNLGGLTALTRLEIMDNASLLSVDVSALSSLEYLSIGECQALTSMEVHGLSELYQLSIEANEHLSSLRVSDLPKLKYLSCSDCASLTSFSVSGFPSLEDLRCDNNNLRTFEMSDLPNVSYIDCSSNQLTSLVVADLPKLSTFVCEDNQLTSLTMRDSRTVGPPWLSVLCGNNNLSSVDLRGVDHWGGFSALDNPLKVVYLRSEWRNGMISLNSYPFWGEQDDEVYGPPEHYGGWQYPRFVWN